MATYANDPVEMQIKYDLYRIPFNEGRGGVAEPIVGASENGMSNSFAKISPDGKWFVYLSFVPTETPAGIHPPYKHVFLRLLPIDGKGEPRVLAYFYGGQGSINTPSWSPDGKRIAFISNTNQVNN